MAITSNIKKGFPKYAEDSEGIRTYDVEYDIQTTAGEGVLAVAASLTQRGAFYQIDGEIDFQAILNNPRIERDPLVNSHWFGIHSYSTKAAKDCTENEDDDPLEERAQVTWGFIISQRVIERDLDGEPLATSAGELFDPPVEDEEYRLECSIVRNVRSYNPLTALRYQNTINSDSFRIDQYTFPKETARMTDWSSGPKLYYGECFSYFQTTMRFQFRENVSLDGQQISGWNKVLLDAGFMHIDDNGDLSVIRDTPGNIITAAVQLDGFGSQATQGASPEFQRFEIHRKRSYAGLFSGIKW